jgi:hypothetical protein
MNVAIFRDIAQCSPLCEQTFLSQRRSTRRYMPQDGHIQVYHIYRFISAILRGTSSDSAMHGTCRCLLRGHKLKLMTDDTVPSSVDKGYTGTARTNKCILTKHEYRHTMDYSQPYLKYTNSEVNAIISRQVTSETWSDFLDYSW